MNFSFFLRQPSLRTIPVNLYDASYTQHVDGIGRQRYGKPLRAALKRFHLRRDAQGIVQ
jgi:hypothetical protein